MWPSPFLPKTLGLLIRFHLAMNSSYGMSCVPKPVAGRRKRKKAGTDLCMRNGMYERGGYR